MRYLFLTVTLFFATGCTQQQVVSALNVVSNTNASSVEQAVSNTNSTTAVVITEAETVAPVAPIVTSVAGPSDTVGVSEQIVAAENQAVVNTNSGGSTATESQAVEETTKTVTAEVRTFKISFDVFSPSGKETYSVTLTEGDAVEEMMERAQAQGFTYKTVGYGSIGKYVQSINGLKEDRRGGMYWIYYINGVRASTGISTYEVKKSDTIKWNYEKEF